MLTVTRDEFKCESISETKKSIEASQKMEEVRAHARELYIDSDSYLEMIATHIFYEDTDFVQEDGQNDDEPEEITDYADIVLRQEHPGVILMVEAIADMKYPSIAGILKQRGFTFEARAIEKLISEYEYLKKVKETILSEPKTRDPF